MKQTKMRRKIQLKLAPDWFGYEDILEEEKIQNIKRKESFLNTTSSIDASVDEEERGGRLSKIVAKTDCLVL